MIEMGGDWDWCVAPYGYAIYICMYVCIYGYSGAMNKAKNEN